MAITDRLTLAPLEGGPVALPLEQIGLQQFFIDALVVDVGAGVLLTVALPAESDRTGLTQPTGRGTGRMDFTPEGFRAGLPSDCCLDDPQDLGWRLGSTRNSWPRRRACGGHPSRPPAIAPPRLQGEPVFAKSR